MAEPIQFQWDLTTRADRRSAWAVLSDSDRMNRVAGFDLQFEVEPQEGRRAEPRGSLNHLGVPLIWRELPVEFSAPEHFTVEREYLSGPLLRAVHKVILSDLPDGGTRVQAHAQFWPRHAVLRPVLQIDLALSFRGKFQRALVDSLQALDRQSEPSAGPQVRLSGAAERKLQAGLAQVADAVLRQRLAQWLQTAPLGDQARILPLRLAKRWQVADQALLVALLQATRGGLLRLQWEVICPSCRLPTACASQLELSQTGSHCPACNVRYDASLADSVALTFAVSAELRPQLPGVACLSSPARMPHLLAQTQLEPGEELIWTLDLLPGNYQLRGWPQIEPLALSVRSDAPARPLSVQATPLGLQPPTLRSGSGRVQLHLRSKLAEPLTLVVERAWLEPHTLTAGQVLQWPEVVAQLPQGALQEGLKIEAFCGPLLAIKVLRGGDHSAQVLAELLRGGPLRALQLGSGWVLATLPGGEPLARVLHALQGALWLAAAVGWGNILELANDQLRMAAGAALQDLVALGHQAEPGQVLARAEAAPLLEPLAGLGWRALPGGELEVVVQQRRAPPLPLAQRRTLPLEVGELVDQQYLLGKRLGAGGFGVVHAAVHAPTGQELVIKLLRPELADDPVQVQRFFDEGRLSARLKSPHVVQVRDWGLSEDGRLFLALEKLEGCELADLLKKQGVLAPDRAVRLACQALAGLGEAHRQGLVHRDIKPANLFVIWADTPQEALKVIDFGIALDLTGQVRQLEAAGDMIGTPAYMAPEQVMGQGLDGRADLYALALVLYEALAGRLPFDAAPGLAMALARLHGEPLPLAQGCAASLPAGLAAVVEAAMASDPAQRPADAAAMEALLQQVLAARPA